MVVVLSVIAGAVVGFCIACLVVLSRMANRIKTLEIQVSYLKQLVFEVDMSVDSCVDYQEILAQRINSLGYKPDPEDLD